MSDEQNFRVVSQLEGLLRRKRQITKYGYNLNLLKRTNMDRKPADSNGRSYLQPFRRAETKKVRISRNNRTFLVPGTRGTITGGPSLISFYIIFLRK